MNIQPKKDKINTAESYRCNKNLFESNEDFVQTEKFILALIKSNILNSDFFLNSRTLNILCSILENISHKDISGMYPTTFLDVKFIIQDLSNFNSINPVLNQTSISNFVKSNIKEILTNMGENGKNLLVSNLGIFYKCEDVNNDLTEGNYYVEAEEIDEIPIKSRLERARIISKLEYEITSDFFTPLTRIVEKLFIDGIIKSNSLPITFQDYQITYLLYSIFNEELSASSKLPVGVYNFKTLCNNFTRFKDIFGNNPDHFPIVDPKKTTLATKKFMIRKLKYDKDLFTKLFEYLQPDYQEKLTFLIEGEKDDNANQIIELSEADYSDDVKTTLLNRLGKLQQSNLLTKKNIEVLQDIYDTTEFEIITIKEKLLNE